MLGARREGEAFDEKPDREPERDRGGGVGGGVGIFTADELLVSDMSAIASSPTLGTVVNENACRGRGE